MALDMWSIEAIQEVSQGSNRVRLLQTGKLQKQWMKTAEKPEASDYLLDRKSRYHGYANERHYGGPHMVGKKGGREKGS